jgi:hypothetical protein
MSDCLYGDRCARPRNCAAQLGANLRQRPLLSRVCAAELPGKLDHLWSEPRERLYMSALPVLDNTVQS